MKAGKLLVGLVSGAALGAVVGLLFAPKKGKEIRNKIGKTSENYINDAKSKFNDFSDNLNDKVEALKAKTKANLSDSKLEQKYNETKKDIHDMKM